MNDLGWTLGWLAAKVAVLLVPAIGLHALAGRRGPASGAWAASLALGMVVVLPLLALLPGKASERPESPATRPAIEGPAGPSIPGPRRAAEVVDRAGPSNDRGRPFAAFRLAWGRFERQATGPVARFRPWGKIVAVVTLVGSGVGLIRLVIGLWAVGICRRRGRAVDDPRMVELVEELRRSMGCGRAIELREVPDLTTPATAGWLRPMLLLPGDWRGWDEPERRAVVAHELAHVIRGDYASGLLARVAVVLNYYHPMVRWLADRLHLDQELAADAMGAEFAGGRSSYLLALSRLALAQDGRPSSWPARAFLPARGTLIRRIAMLKTETESKRTGQSWSKPRRLATALGLLALTIGVATFKTPAGAADDKPAPAPSANPEANATGARPVVEPFEMDYLPEGITGAVGVRPSGMARRLGAGIMRPFVLMVVGGDFKLLAKRLGVDMSRPGFIRLGVEDIEALTCGFSFGKPRGEPMNSEGKSLHSLEFGSVTVRTVQPFDWPAFFRQWTMELVEVKEPRGVYYKAKDPARAEFLMGCVFYQPDARTVVYEGEARVKELIAREVPSRPAYLRGEDWDRVSRDLVAVAFNNRDDAFAKKYDLGRPDDKMVLELAKGIDRWMLGVADADPIALRAEVAAREPRAAEAVARSIQSFANLGRAALDARPPGAGMQDRAAKLASSFLKNLNVAQQGSSLILADEGFATFAGIADLAKAFYEAERVVETQTKAAGAAAKAEEVKADPKLEKR